MPCEHCGDLDISSASDSQLHTNIISSWVKIENETYLSYNPNNEQGWADSLFFKLSLY